MKSVSQTVSDMYANAKLSLVCRCVIDPWHWSLKTRIQANQSPFLCGKLRQVIWIQMITSRPASRLRLNEPCPHFTGTCITKKHRHTEGRCQVSNMTYWDKNKLREREIRRSSVHHRNCLGSLSLWLPSYVRGLFLHNFKVYQKGRFQDYISYRFLRNLGEKGKVRKWSVIC